MPELPNSIWHVILQNLSYRDFASLACTSTQLYLLAVDSLPTAGNNEKILCCVAGLQPIFNCRSAGRLCHSVHLLSSVIFFCILLHHLPGPDFRALAAQAAAVATVTQGTWRTSLYQQAWGLERAAEDKLSQKEIHASPTSSSSTANASPASFRRSPSRAAGGSSAATPWLETGRNFTPASQVLSRCAILLTDGSDASLLLGQRPGGSGEELAGHLPPRQPRSRPLSTQVR